VKVVFVFGGLPHYFNKVMNRINAHPDIDVSVIAPSEKSVTMGSGVHETESGVDFNIIRLKEYSTWYGKPFFHNFKQTLVAERPDAIIIGWPYFLAFIFMPSLLFFIKRNKIRLISKEIPFTVPGFNESLKDFSARCAESQKSEAIFKNIWVFRLHKLLRKYLYTFVFNQAVLYIEKGVAIISSYGLPAKNIKVTYNSPDTDDIFATIDAVKHKFPELHYEPYRILHVGRLVKWKNVHLLVEAIDALKSKYPGIKLAVIGKGEEEANLKLQVSQAGLDPYVEFLGAIYEGEEQSLQMLRAHVYVLAGMGGLSINEAMAHGLPVICSIADGTEQHLVKEGVNGFYFKDNDLSSLIDAIDQLFSANHQQLGAEALNTIKNKINIQTVSANYIEAILQKSH